MSFEFLAFGFSDLWTLIAQSSGVRFKLHLERAISGLGAVVFDEVWSELVCGANGCALQWLGISAYCDRI